MQENSVQSLGLEDPLGKDSLPTPVFLDFRYGSAGKEYMGNELEDDNLVRRLL